MRAASTRDDGPGGRSRARLATALALALPIAAATTVAAASAAGTRSATLAAGQVSVTACGAVSAATVAYRVTAGAVTGVSVSGLPASCDGARLTVTLTSSGADAGHGGPAVISGGAATIAVLSASPSPSSLTDARLAVAGP